MLLGTSLLVAMGLVIAEEYTCVATNYGISLTCLHTGAVAGLGVAGGLSILAGIPLVVYGSRKVPRGEGATSSLSRWAGAPSARGWRWEL
jgi:hypothetical protein